MSTRALVLRLTLTHELAAAAIATLDPDVRPDIQSHHGSGFIAREFAGTLAESGVTHTRMRPRTPTDNAEIERYHRTICDRIEEELEDVTQAKAVIARSIDSYNHVRLSGPVVLATGGLLSVSPDRQAWKSGGAAG